MQRPVLYLMLGYPGAGKTTASRLLRQLTGAVHLWADHERRRLFQPPTYSHAENLALYDDLNARADQLLASGQSVIFDTNFGLHKDREHLRQIAGRHGANTVVVWVVAPKDLARQRATKDAHKQDTRVLGDMPADKFEHIVGTLETPRPGEQVVELDGTKLDRTIVAHALGLPLPE